METGTRKGSDARETRHNAQQSVPSIMDEQKTHLPVIHRRRHGKNSSPSACLGNIAIESLMVKHFTSDATAGQQGRATEKYAPWWAVLFLIHFFSADPKKPLAV